MEIHLAFKKMDATEALKRHATERSERLKKFAPTQSQLHWVFFLEADVHVADLRISGPHMDFFAQAKSPDMYQSIEEAVEKLEKQLRKHKEIVKNHLHRDRSTPSSDEGSEAAS